MRREDQANENNQKEMNITKRRVGVKYRGGGHGDM